MFSGKCFYKSNINIAMLKNTSVEQVSTIVVISGAAIIAGSRCNLFASIGSMHPISLDITTVAIIAKLTVIDNSNGLVSEDV